MVNETAQTKECCRRTKERDADEYRALLNRLKRIEGQVRGLSKMVEESAYCTDILTQVSAVQAALSAFSREILANHIRECVVRDIKRGELDVVDELVYTVERLMK